jgi:hypothetical protein
MLFQYPDPDLIDMETAKKENLHHPKRLYVSCCRKKHAVSENNGVPMLILQCPKITQTHGSCFSGHPHTTSDR